MKKNGIKEDISSIFYLMGLGSIPTTADRAVSSIVRHFLIVCGLLPSVVQILLGRSYVMILEVFYVSTILTIVLCFVRFFNNSCFLESEG